MAPSRHLEAQKAAEEHLGPVPGSLNAIDGRLVDRSAAARTICRVLADAVLGGSPDADEVYKDVGAVLDYPRGRNRDFARGLTEKKRYPETRHSFQRRHAEARRLAAQYGTERGIGRDAMTDLLLVMAYARSKGHQLGLGLAQGRRQTVLPLLAIPIAYFPAGAPPEGRRLRADARENFQTAAEMVLRRRQGAGEWTGKEEKMVERLWLAAADHLPSADHLRAADAGCRDDLDIKEPGVASARARQGRRADRQMDKLLRSKWNTDRTTGRDGKSYPAAKPKRDR